MEMETRGASLEELLTVISGHRGRSAVLDGKIDEGTMTCGQGVGLIKSEPTVKEVIDGMVTGAAELLNRLTEIPFPILSRKRR